MSPKYSVYVTRWETCRLRGIEARSEEEAQTRGRELLDDEAEYQTIETGIDHIDADLEEE